MGPLTTVRRHSTIVRRITRHCRWRRRDREALLMILLRRALDVLLLWLPVAAAILICYAVSCTWSPGGQPRSDATMPLPRLRPSEQRGPSADELIERFDREFSRSASRSCLVE